MKITQILSKSIPELYVLVLVLLSGITVPFAIHPVALVFAFLVIGLIISQHVIFGQILTFLFGLVSLFGLVALVFELKEFSSLSIPFLNLLAGGTLFLGVNGITLYKLGVKYYVSAEAIGQEG